MVIVENPEPFVGQRVTVSSEVEEVISTSAFTLDSPTAIGNRLLVIRITPGEVTVIEGVPVQVTGTVREFELPAIEEEVGVALDDEAFTEFEGRPAIVAQSISPLGLR